jgi:hypothetical protein
VRVKDVCRSVCRLSSACNHTDLGFFVNSNPEATCEWVGEDPDVRCKRRSSNGVKAENACPSVCNLSCVCMDTYWFFANSNPEATCEWVGKNPDVRCKKEAALV